MKKALSTQESFESFFETELADYVLKTTQEGRSAIVALVGDLGAGKSTLTRKLCAFLGIAEKIPSPTFLLMKEYTIKDKNLGKEALVHVDAYRIVATEELVSLGLAEKFKDSRKLFVIEWADKVRDIIPLHAAWFNMSAAGEEERFIERIL